ncbi:MAG: hypothetical protein H6570_03225 [Lewinellaceae bacterium]|nr:hypothetical protein [Lewinellaceae bacterium]
MKYSIPFILAIILILLGPISRCHQKVNNPNPALNQIELLRGDIIMCSGKDFGEVDFAMSCDYSVRETFELAISLLHSFEYDEAEKAFVQVIDADPNCAMAYWGIAMSIYHALWEPPGPEQLKKGEKILQIAATIPKTEREAEYLAAIGEYYHHWESADPKTRAQKMADKMEAIYLKYPDDNEAAILYALALNTTADPADQNFTNQRKAGSILESLFSDHPNHPGIAHYIIHNYDNPVLASKALVTARKYAQIAPASAHAQHMPSHIFTRLGLWDESIESNLNSIASAVCYADQAGFNAHWDEELHGMDYIVYAYLQRGNNGQAAAQNDYLKTFEKVYPVNFKVAYAMAAIPARMVLENKDWKTAANLTLPPMDFPWEQFPWQASILHFTRALGAAHTGDLQAAYSELAQLDTLQAKLSRANNTYQANQVMIQSLAAKGWIKWAEGNFEEALSLMEDAANREDHTTKHPVTPCEVLPARELLADLLLTIDRPEQALMAYQMDLNTHPNRLNGLYGAAVSALKLNDTEAAKNYYQKLADLAGGEVSERSEIAEASDYLFTHQ